MTLDYITIPTAILRLKDLNLRQKLLLALIITFDENGLKMGNEAIAELLEIWPCRVSGLLKDMEVKSYIQVDNHQSRYRVIYLSKSAKVDELLLITKSISKDILLITKSKSTYHQTDNIIKRKGPKRAHKAQKPVCDNETFDQFWESYPKKVAKVETQEAWAKLNPTPELVKQIIAAVERQKQTRQWLEDNGRYVQNPTTWLNKKRWTDELPDNEFSTHEATEEEVEVLIREGVLPS